MRSCGLHAPLLTARGHHNEWPGSEASTRIRFADELDPTQHSLQFSQDASRSWYGLRWGRVLPPFSHPLPLCLFAYLGHAGFEPRAFRVGRSNAKWRKTEDVHEGPSLLHSIKPRIAQKFERSAAVGRCAGFSCTHRLTKFPVAVASSSGISIFSSSKRALIGQSKSVRFFLSPPEDDQGCLCREISWKRHQMNCLPFFGRPYLTKTRPPFCIGKYMGMKCTFRALLRLSS